MAKRKSYSSLDYKRWSEYHAKNGPAKTKKRFGISNSVMYNGFKNNSYSPGTMTGRVSGKVLHASNVPKEIPKGFDRRPSIDAIVLLRKAVKLIEKEQQTRAMSASDAYVKLALEALEGR